MRLWFASGIADVPTAGNPTYFLTLVTANIEPQRVSGYTEDRTQKIKQQLVHYACGDLLRMDSEVAASQYMRAVKRHKQCPSIVCQGLGTMLASSGEVSDGGTHKAPATFDGMPQWFDTLPKESRPEYQMWQKAEEAVIAIPRLESDQHRAEVR